jgi:hypothetical protein
MNRRGVRFTGKFQTRLFGMAAHNVHVRIIRELEKRRFLAPQHPFPLIA